MAYKVVLIDDEPWTMVYLKQIFKWQEKGFEIVAELQNSVEAIDVIARVMPDVVFTDIRMPQLSGIELMQKIRELDIHCEFIIISGFAEFSYAQEAIRHGAFEYCLKPVNVEKAEEILGRLIKQLEGKNTIPAHERTEPVAEAVNDNFKKMLDYMQVHLNKKLQLKELAEAYYLHPNYCCQLFNKTLGMTFSEYLTGLRMKEASELLSSGKLTVNEAARHVGYDDYFYFNKVFKKNFGVTPAEYRKGLRKGRCSNAR